MDECGGGDGSRGRWVGEEEGGMGWGWWWGGG